ncbi:MAG: DUF2459 domain-containing protein [Sphingorhabdus sp.]
MKLPRVNGLLSVLRAVVGLPLLILALYFFGALAGSIFPANNGWQQPDEGIELFVETNGVHVSLIVPMQVAGEDLSDLIRPQDMAQPMLYGTHAMIGWGHEGVYRNAQTWAQVRSGDVTSAAFGSDETVLHVYHRINPQPSRSRRAFRVNEAQFHQIIADIRSTFALSDDGQPVAYSAYGEDNLFYAARGRYSAFNTCNEWTASLLRRAGVRVGLWTPMAGGVMRWFPEK